MNSVAMDALKYSGYMGSLYGSNSTGVAGSNTGSGGSNSSDPSSAIKSIYSSQDSTHPTSLSSSGLLKVLFEF